MDCYQAIAFKLYQVWRRYFYFNASTYKTFEVTQARLWDMNNWHRGPITVPLRCKDSDLSSFVDSIEDRDDMVLEICYEHRDVEYIILYEIDRNSIVFPPYSDESDTPSLRMPSVDFDSIEISESRTSEDEADDGNISTSEE